MKKKIFSFLISLFILQYAHSQNKLKSPEEFLGYPKGKDFTYHHQVVDYFSYIAANSPKVRLQEYGKTYENRPLIIAYVSSQENISRKEEIRKNNLIRTGLIKGKAKKENIPLVWLSYNVHGNEAVSSEAAMEVLYTLASGEDQKVDEWLENTVVLIDPVLNPDGRERYVSWYKQVANRIPNPNPDSWEHHEPWPGGRPNHYLFDLNRDWAWQTQKETQQRMSVYNNWLPHIHADFHEQGIESPYYFAPAAEPFHDYITNWQREFQTTIGINNMKYFDEKGWLYFTKENFDLLYPSYGDTYPTFNGAIGMTYEQGGSGKAGVSVLMEEKDTLTLEERINHHYITSLSTIEASSQNAKAVVENYANFYKNSIESPPGKYKSYVFPLENEKDKLVALRQLLDMHQIAYKEAAQNKLFFGWSYQEGGERNLKVGKGDLVVEAKQPKAVLLQVLFEPTTKLRDTLTYDITAWAVPYMLGLKAFAIPEEISTKPYKESEQFELDENSEAPYAFLLEWKSLEDVKFLSRLLKEGVKVRFSDEQFILQNKNFRPGSLIITKKGNEGLGEKFGYIVSEAAKEWERQIKAVETGFVAEGKDFGSSSVHFLKKPTVAVLAGEGVSSLAFGEVWHFFERQINYPITVIGTEIAEAVNWSKYDVIILPDGKYERMLDQHFILTLNNWVREGGRLILMEGAIQAIENMIPDNLGISMKQESVIEQELQRNPLLQYKDKKRGYLTNYNPGSIYRVKLDQSHPLAYGYQGDYFSLKTGTEAYDYLKNGWNVGTIRSRDALVSGYVGENVQKNLKESLVFGVEEMGKGDIVYMVDNPLFRAFWQSGKLLFSNAVFMVGQ